MASAGAALQMLQVAYAVPSKYHDELAYTLVHSGCTETDVALQLDGISAIMRMLILMKIGKVENARAEGVQLWFKVLVARVCTESCR